MAPSLAPSAALDEGTVSVTAEQVATLQLLGQALVAGMEHEALLQELERQRANALLALHDALTGLPNRRAFDNALEAGIARAAVDHAPYALLFIDIDHFKGVNDTYGHEVGDAALRFVAARLTRALRGGDLLFRFGGEELVALLPGTSAAAALATAQRLRRALLRAPHPQGAWARWPPIEPARRDDIDHQCRRSGLPHRCRQWYRIDTPRRRRHVPR